jgi:hypothetical protein
MENHGRPNQEIATSGIGKLAEFARHQSRAAHVSCGAILDRFTTESSHTLPRADRPLGAIFRTHALQQKAQLLYHIVGAPDPESGRSALRAFDLLSFNRRPCPSTRIENRRNFCFASCQQSVPKIWQRTQTGFSSPKKSNMISTAFPMNFNQHRCVGRPCLFCNERKRLPQGRTSATARVFGSSDHRRTQNGMARGQADYCFYPG